MIFSCEMFNPDKEEIRHLRVELTFARSGVILHRFVSEAEAQTVCAFELADAVYAPETAEALPPERC